MTMAASVTPDFITTPSGYATYGGWMQESWQLARDLLDETIEPHNLAAAISGFPDTAELYPQLDVPVAFAQEHPGLLFRPALDTTELREEPSRFSMRRVLSMGVREQLMAEPALCDESLLTVTGLQEAVRLLLSRTKHEDAIARADVLAATISRAFLSNAELYRLTQDTNGAMLRWGRLIGEFNVSPAASRTMVGNLAPSILEQAYGRLTHWWFREYVSIDSRVSGVPRYPYLDPAQRIARHDTVAGLLEEHDVALDLRERNALVTIKRPAN